MAIEFDKMDDRTVTVKTALRATMWMCAFMVLLFATGVNLLLLLWSLGGNAVILAVTALWTGAATVKLHDALYKIKRG